MEAGWLGGLIGIAVVLFVTTNIDDVFVLLAFLADPRMRPAQVAFGQALGIALLYGASVVVSLLSLVIAPAYIGLLGLAPIAIGMKKAWDLRKATDDDANASAGDAALTLRGGALPVAAVTIANGGDNIGAYAPLFATYTGVQIAIVGVVFAVMTAVWVALAYFLINHPLLGRPIRHFGNLLAPWVLIALGCFILYDAGSFALLMR
jgi:cadmium resistance protein CadD (predicted permease)